MNGLTNEVREFCINEGLIKPGMTVVAGVSGGADSVCLLLILNELGRELDLKIRCVHIEHGIRGIESCHDMEFVKDLCERLGLPLKIVREDVPARAAEMSMTLEEAGRYIRYDAFMNEAKAYNADVIAVAHHLNDQAETVLFNLARGSGLKGASGMAPRRGNIIRPLLNTTRAEIEEYLKARGQDYCTDSTNKDTGYSRNGIRQIIIPGLEGVVNGASEHIARAADEIREADDLLRSLALKAREQIVSVNGSRHVIDIEGLLEQPAIIRRYIIRSVLTDMYETHKDLEALHVIKVLELTGKSSGRLIELPKGMIALREGGHIVTGSREDVYRDKDRNIEITLDTDGDTLIPGAGVISCRIEEYDGAMPPDGLYTKWFDYDKIENTLVVRTRREGDYLTIDDQGKRKKLKKYLVDEKVPVSERDSLLLIADGDHIVWAIGKRISAYYKITDETHKVLKMERRI